MTIFHMQVSHWFSWGGQILSWDQVIEQSRAERDQKWGGMWSGSYRNLLPGTLLTVGFGLEYISCTTTESSCFLLICTSLLSLLFPEIVFLLLHWLLLRWWWLVVPKSSLLLPGQSTLKSAKSTWNKYSVWYWLHSFPLLGCGAIDYLITKQKQPCCWIYTGKRFKVPGGINFKGKGPEIY